MVNVLLLAKKINGTIQGDSKILIEGIGDLRTSPDNFASFLSDNRYYKYFEKTLSKVVIVDKNFSQPTLGKTLIKVDNPVFAYIKVLEYFNSSKKNKNWYS